MTLTDGRFQFRAWRFFQPSNAGLLLTILHFITLISHSTDSFAATTAHPTECRRLSCAAILRLQSTSGNPRPTSSSSSADTAPADQHQSSVQNDDSNEALFITNGSVKLNDPSKTPPSSQFGDSVQFGQVVRPKYLDKDADPPVGLTMNADSTNRDDSTTASKATPSDEDLAASLRRRNLNVAVGSIALALANFAWQFFHPIEPVQLLMSMQAESPPLSVIGKNGKPTVVDFWAPWCENCKLIAPTLLQIEQEYGDKVNFVMVNADKREAWSFIDAFGVDAIPHLALVSANGDVETALIGPIPKRVLRADLDVLLENAARASPADGNSRTSAPPTKLPYTMLDVFADAPEKRRVQFD
jgi:thiol-disulfide isomerase/thioredoxin